MAEKVLTVKQALTITDVIELLESSPDPERVIHEPPQRPKAGQVYLFSSEKNPDKKSKFLIIIIAYSFFRIQCWNTKFYDTMGLLLIKSRCHISE